MHFCLLQTHFGPRADVRVVMLHCSYRCVAQQLDAIEFTPLCLHITEEVI
jgi:hypothetical protein